MSIVTKDMAKMLIGDCVKPFYDAPFKYNEASLVEELKQYIESTYGQHYVGDNSIQYMDIVMADAYADARGFLKHNSGKYINRVGKKDGFNRKDVLKAMHYCVLLLHLHDIKHEVSE